jgi:excisionase family DNA binding protein
MRSEVAGLRDMLLEIGQTPANDEVLTRKQAAELLHLNIESISKLVRDEGLPCKRVGHEYRFLRSQVLAWLAARGGEG